MGQRTKKRNRFNNKRTIQPYKKRFTKRKQNRFVRNKTYRPGLYNKHVKNASTLNVRCSPTVKEKRFTCLTNENLFKLKDMWNARHPDVKIISKDPKQIWEALNEHMANTCSKESCWLKQKFVDGKLDTVLENAYAPESPKTWLKKPNEWLTSVDILKVMKHYEKAFPCFEFMGPSPIDYDTIISHDECVWEELCRFNLLQQIKRGKTKIGVIFNTDPHNKGGAHWISMFINIKKRFIYFYDSVGTPIPDRAKVFADTIIQQGAEMKPPMHITFDQNSPIEHQQGNTECGVYSLFFLIHMLEDKIDAHYLKTHTIDDKYMEKFRKIYFNEDLAK